MKQINLKNFKKLMAARSRPSLVVGLLSIVLAGTPLGIISILGTIYIWAKHLPLPRLFRTTVSRYLISFILLCCGIQLLGIFFWIVGLKMLPILSVTILVLFGLLFKPKQAPKPFDTSDIFAVIVALASVGIIAIAYFSSGTLGANLLRFSTSGFDDSQHMSMSLSMYKEEGYLYGPASEIKSKIIYDNRAGYPMGWHLTNGVIWNTLGLDLDSKANPNNALFVYQTTKLLWYFFCVYYVVMTILAIAKAQLDKHLGSYGAAVAFTLLVQFSVLYSILQFGFANFLPIFPYLIGIMLLSYSFLDDNKEKLSTYLLLSLLLAVGVTFTWLLIAPVAYIAIALALVQRYGGLWGAIKAIWREKALIIAGIILVLSAAMQGVFQIKYSIVPDNLNLDGGIGPLDWGILYIATAAAVSIGIIRTKSFVKIMPILAGSTILTAFIYGYQMTTAGKVTYYFTKVAFVTLVLLIISLAIFTAAKIRREGFGLVQGIVTGLTICSLIAVAGAINSNGAEYALGNKSYLSRADAQTVSTLLNENKISEGNFLFLKREDYSEDMLTTQFVYMLSRSYPVCKEAIIYNLIQGKTDELIDKNLAACLDESTEPYYIVASPKTAPQIVERYGNNNPKVKLLVSED